MLDRIRGRVRARREEAILLDLGPVSLEIGVPRYLAEVLPPGKEVELFTVLLQDETGLHLFGFREPEERALFQRLLEIPGVGKKASLRALARGRGALMEALRNADSEEGFQWEGLGPRTARRVWSELRREALQGKWEGGAPTAPETVLSALRALGVPERRAREVLQRALRDQRHTTAEELLKEALRWL